MSSRENQVRIGSQRGATRAVIRMGEQHDQYVQLVPEAQRPPGPSLGEQAGMASDMPTMGDHHRFSPRDDATLFAWADALSHARLLADMFRGTVIEVLPANVDPDWGGA